MTRAPFPVLVVLSLAACTPEVALDVTAWGEGYIEEGIPAADLIDGWSVGFDRFLVSLAAVDVTTTKDAEPVPLLERALLVDLARGSDGEGHPLASATLPLAADASAAYRVAYDADAAPGPSMSDLETDALVAGGCSLLVEGSATRGDDERRFSWCFTTDTTYRGCPLATDEGFDAQLTVHADHLFYDDLDSEEPNVAFNLIAAADADDDGEVTRAELEATEISGEERYQVGGRDIQDLWGFLAAQTRTVGHINGEGHCEGAE